MDIFVVGATGFIGSHIGARLAKEGHKVTGLTRNAAKAPVLHDLGMSVHIGDVEDVESLVQVIQSTSAVVFAPQLLVEPEHVVVSALLTQMEGSGKAFIFTSGTGVLGQRTGGAWSQDSFAEDDPFVPLKAIQRRVDTELVVRTASTRGVRSMVVRPPAVWGGGPRGQIADAYHSVGKVGSACYVGAGLNMYSNVHVDDLANLYALALERGVSGALYHAVCGEMANRWVAESVAHDLGCGTRSVSVEEAMEIWSRRQALINLSVSSRCRAVRSRDELGWAATRFNMLEEVGREDFRAMALAQG